MSERRPIACDVEGLMPDLAAVDALARAQLAVRRAGLDLQLCHASDELQRLVSLCGLEAVLRSEAEREPEEREDALGVEEERQLDDPAL